MKMTIVTSNSILNGSMEIRMLISIVMMMRPSMTMTVAEMALNLMSHTVIVIVILQSRCLHCPGYLNKTARIVLNDDEDQYEYQSGKDLHEKVKGHRKKRDERRRTMYYHTGNA